MPADLRMHRTPNIDASMREMIASVTHRQKIEAYEDDDDDDDPDSMSKGEEIWVPEEVTWYKQIRNKCLIKTEF